MTSVVRRCPLLFAAHVGVGAALFGRAGGAGYIRYTSGILQASKQLEALFGGVLPKSGLQSFEQAQGVAQHHDSVSGTSKQHVAFDYAKRLAAGVAVADGLNSNFLGAAVTVRRPPLREA
jgi:hypothetical protein